MTRKEALELLHEYTASDALRRHALAVETSMLSYARTFGEDEEKWGVAGLLHDFDYEKYPDAPDHPLKGSEILAHRGVSEEIRRAILGHATYTGVPRDTKLARILFACDELCGFISACAVIRPNKIADLEVKSVKKKIKDKGFARAVNRDDIQKGAEEAGLDLDRHIATVIEAMRGIAPDLGL